MGSAPPEHRRDRCGRADVMGRDGMEIWEAIYVNTEAPREETPQTAKLAAPLLRSQLRKEVEAALGPLRDLPGADAPDSTLWQDWGQGGPFAVRLGRGECAS